MYRVLCTSVNSGINSTAVNITCSRFCNSIRKNVPDMLINQDVGEVAVDSVVRCMYRLSAGRSFRSQGYPGGNNRLEHA